MLVKEKKLLDNVQKQLKCKLGNCGEHKQKSNAPSKNLQIWKNLLLLAKLVKLLRMQT